MMIKMQLNITLKYSIMNILTIKKRIYLMRENDII